MPRFIMEKSKRLTSSASDPTNSSTPNSYSSVRTRVIATASATSAATTLIILVLIRVIRKWGWKKRDVKYDKLDLTSNFPPHFPGLDTSSGLQQGRIDPLTLPATAITPRVRLDSNTPSSLRKERYRRGETMGLSADQLIRHQNITTFNNIAEHFYSFPTIGACHLPPLHGRKQGRPRFTSDYQNLHTRSIHAMAPNIPISTDQDNNAASLPTPRPRSEIDNGGNARESVSSWVLLARHTPPPPYSSQAPAPSTDEMSTTEIRPSRTGSGSISLIPISLRPGVLTP